MSEFDSCMDVFTMATCEGSQYTLKSKYIIQDRYDDLREAFRLIDILPATMNMTQPSVFVARDGTVSVSFGCHYYEVDELFKEILALATRFEVSFTQIKDSCLLTMEFTFPSIWERADEQ